MKTVKKIKDNERAELNMENVVNHLESPVSHDELEQALKQVREDKIKKAASMAIEEHKLNRGQLIEQMCSGLAPLTQRNYIAHVNLFYGWLDGPGPGNLLGVKSADAAQYIRWLNERYKPNTVRTLVAAVHGLYAMLVRDEYRTGNPFYGKRLPRRQFKANIKAAKGEKAVFDNADIARITAAAADRGDDVGEAVLILANYGLRVGALDDLEIHNGNFITATTKSGYIVRLSSEDIGGDGGLLKSLPPKPFGQKRTCIGLRRQVAVFMEKYGGTPHDLRHAFAVTQYKRTKDVYTVKRLLGHQSVANTEHYLKSLGLFILE